MKIFKTIVLAVLLGSVTASAESTLEPLMGHFVSHGGVQIQVRSGGCTSKKQFEVSKEMRGAVIQLRFMRLQVDPCRAYIPYGEILTFSFEELGLNSGDLFKISNPETPARVSKFQ